MSTAQRMKDYQITYSDLGKTEQLAYELGVLDTESKCRKQIDILKEGFWAALRWMMIDIHDDIKNGHISDEENSCQTYINDFSKIMECKKLIEK